MDLLEFQLHLLNRIAIIDVSFPELIALRLISFNSVLKAVFGIFKLINLNLQRLNLILVIAHSNLLIVKHLTVVALALSIL
jgi:uncharacterized radical SAM superfamily protein